ncbi:MAG: response regulator [Chloroflexota bacterium]
MRILYVEDNPANLFLVQRVARMGNHEVVNYTEGQPALDHFKEDKPDLVLMDIQLSGILNGLDVVKALRAAGHRTPIVAVTAYAMSGDREKCIEAGCDGYLSKPLPVGELVELFKRYEPAKAAAAASVVPASSVTAAPEWTLNPVSDVKPTPEAQPVPAAPATPEAPPAAPTITSLEKTNTDIPPNPFATPVLLKADATPTKDSAPVVTPAHDVEIARESVEKPIAPVVEPKVESPVPTPETAKPVVNPNPVDSAASQGTSKESSEKIGLESKPS